MGYAGTTTFADDILSHDFKKLASMKSFIEELANFRIKYRKRIAERFLLESIGTNLKEFSQNQQNYPDSFKENIYEQLSEDKLGVDFLVAGFEKGFPKIYTIGDHGVYMSAHSIGYSAIGIGEDHASSFYMVNGFKFNTPLREALFFAFSAKKSAEIAAGVGKCTDIWVLEKDQEPVFYEDGCGVITQLEKIYQKSQENRRLFHQNKLIPELNKIIMAGIPNES